MEKQKTGFLGSSYLRRFSEMYKAGYYIEALRSAEALVHITPASAMAWEKMGIVLMKLQRNREAVSSFNKSLQIDSNRSMATAGRSICFVRMIKEGVALQAIEAAIKIFNGNDSYLYMDRALYRSKTREYRKAISDCSYYLESVSVAAADDYQFRANLHFAVGNYSEAIDDYSRALQNWPWGEKGKLFIMRARALAALGQHDLALFDAHKAVSEMPTSPYAHLVLKLIKLSIRKTAG